jgi:diguanylate cyclase (GGDEF) domain
MNSGDRRHLDQVIYILKNSWHKIPPESEAEFDKELLKTNIYRGKIAAIFLLIAVLPLLYLDYHNYQNGMWLRVPTYRLLLFGHILLALAMLIPLIIIPAIKPHSESRAFCWQRNCMVCFFMFILIATAIISMADQKTGGAITAYIIGVLGIAAIACLKPFTSLLIYLFSFGLFLAGISAMQSNPELLTCHYINSAFLVSIGWIFSVTLFNTKVSDFLNRKGLEYYADFDYLTGCFNRRAFIKRLDEEIARSKREQTPISILLIDVDLFKQVNDQYGHKAGDLVLQQLIECFHGSSRKYDFIGRFGGEEFIICLPNTALNTASEVAERFRGLIENTQVISDSSQISFTISVGVAALESTYNENLDKFISRADSAMYQAKLKRNNVCLSTK